MARNGVVCRRLRTEVKQAHVLAVDDSLVDRKVIEKLLRISSYKVTVVDSGRRALQFLGLDEDQSSVVGGLKVDLIITDYCMPGMTGYELLKKIKESSTFKEVPVVIMSSENVVTKINRCLEEGAEDYFVKPVKLDDVKRLKEYMMREDKSTAHKSRINKRKSMDGSDDSTSSSSTSDSRSPSPRTSTESSPSTSSETRSASPSGPLDSPTRRRRISIDDPNVAES